MPALMVQGVSSWAGQEPADDGARPRCFARRGVRVAPFKGQNMSNNARVVAGGEIGVAQYLQALAAGIEPDVRMNPVLVKPEGERAARSSSTGGPTWQLSALPWRERGPALWPPIERALASLLAEYELVVIEGAGSPAEINLRTPTSRTCGWPMPPGRRCCSWPTSTAAARSRTSTARGRCSTSPSARRSGRSCSTSSAATRRCWRPLPPSSSG